MATRYSRDKAPVAAPNGREVGRKKLDIKADEVLQKWKDGTDSIRQELFDYYLNFHFIEGQQWIFWNPQQRRLDQVPRDPDRVRLTINRMRANSRTVIGKLTSRALNFEVPPTDADDAHVRGAKLSESLLEHTRRSHKWEELREQWYWSLWKAGTAAIFIEWDPNLGEDAANPDDTGGVKRKQGDTIESVRNLSQFCVEPGTADAEKSRWAIVLDLLPPKEAQAKYNLKEEPVADGATADTPFLLKLADKASGTTLTPLTQVFTYYERPNYLNEKGCIKVVIDGECVWESEWPYPWTEHLNMVVGHETKIENRWTGGTVVTDARPIQTALNQSWSNIVEHMKRAGNARLVMPQSAADQFEELSDLPGEVLPYPDGSQEPDWKGAPQMPQWWVDQPSKLAEELDDIMSVHQISRGDAPQNIESGYGLSILAEHDATPTERILRETANVFGRLASMYLKLIEAEVTTKRKTIINDTGQAATTIEWSGKDLMGQTTAVVPEDSIIPRSRAALMEAGKSMVEMGFITNMADFAFFTEMPSSRMLLEAVNPDIARARRENAYFAAGRASVPFEWDDDEAHIMEHNRFRKSTGYEVLDDEVKLMIEDHVQAHVTAAAEKLGKQQAAGAIGGPGLAAAPTVAGAAPAPPEMNPPFAGTPVPPAASMMPEGGYFSPDGMANTTPGASGAPEISASSPEAEQIFNGLMQQLNSPTSQT